MSFELQMIISAQIPLRLTLLRKLALVVCLFLLSGCKPDYIGTIDSEETTKDAGGSITVEVTDDQSTAPEPEGGKGGEKMEYATKELLKGFRAPTQQKLPHLTIFYAQAAWEKYEQNQERENPDLARISVDWKISVVLLIEPKSTGGMEASPYISSLTRDGDVVNMEIDWRIDPNIPMLDVELQPWLIAEAPAEAFIGNPEIRFTVKGQGQGEVIHNRE